MTATRSRTSSIRWTMIGGAVLAGAAMFAGGCNCVMCTQGFCPKDDGAVASPAPVAPDTASDSTPAHKLTVIGAQMPAAPAGAAHGAG